MIEMSFSHLVKLEVLKVLYKKSIYFSLFLLIVITTVFSIFKYQQLGELGRLNYSLADTVTFINEIKFLFLILILMTTIISSSSLVDEYHYKTIHRMIEFPIKRHYIVTAKSISIMFVFFAIAFFLLLIWWIAGILIFTFSDAELTKLTIDEIIFSINFILKSFLAITLDLVGVITLVLLVSLVFKNNLVTTLFIMITLFFLPDFIGLLNISEIIINNFFIVMIGFDNLVHELGFSIALFGQVFIYMIQIILVHFLSIFIFSKQKFL